MERARYKAPSQACQVNTCHGAKGAAIAAGPGRSWRGNQPQHGAPSRAMLLAAVAAGLRKKARQDEGKDKRPRQWQQVQADNTLVMLLCSNRASRGRTQQQEWKHRGRRHVNREDQRGQQEREKDLMEQDPCASSSNGCGRQGGQHRGPVHGQLDKEPGKAQWQGHSWRGNWKLQPLQHTEPLHQGQAGVQSGSGQKRELLWNAKKRCWITASRLPAALRREARTRLRPMNMAGYRLPGMCTPHPTSQYLVGQHDYMQIDEREAAVEVSGEVSNCSTEGEDFPSHGHFPSQRPVD